MREPIRDKERLQHIVEAADFVIEQTSQVNREEFMTNKLLYGAVVYYTMIIGEACYKLSKEFVNKYNDTPWSDIAGMRHHIVHGYYKVDNRILWDIITKDIPALRDRVQRYLDEIDWKKWENQKILE